MLTRYCKQEKMESIQSYGENLHRNGRDKELEVTKVPAVQPMDWQTAGGNLSIDSTKNQESILNLIGDINGMKSSEDLHGDWLVVKRKKKQNKKASLKG